MLPEGAPAAVLTLKLTGLLHGSQEGNFRGEEGQQPWPEPQGHVASSTLEGFHHLDSGQNATAATAFSYHNVSACSLVLDLCFARQNVWSVRRGLDPVPFSALSFGLIWIELGLSRVSSEPWKV